MIRDTAAQAARLAAAERLVEEVLIPAEPRMAADDRIPDEALAALRAHGLFGISIPEEHGGLGLTMEEEAELMLERSLGGWNRVVIGSGSARRGS